MTKQRNKKPNGKTSEVDLEASTQNGGKTKPVKNFDDLKVDECKVCRQEFTDPNHEMIICDRCDCYVCRACGEITTEQYALLIDNSCKFHWFCEECERPALTAVKKDKLIEQKCNEILDDFKKNVLNDLKSQILDLRKEIDTLKGDKSVPSNLTANVQKNYVEAVKKDIASQVTAESAKELAERERRKHNIILFGIPESNAEELNERIADDKTFVISLCKETLDTDVDISTCKRLRSKAPGKRPLLISVKNEAQASGILRNGHKLRQSESHQNIFLKKDYTPLEREEMRRLVEMRDKKREETIQKGGEEKWTIWRGKIVDSSRRLGKPADRKREEEKGN